MKKLIYRTLDRMDEYLRYPQPNILQQMLLGQHTDVIDTEFTANRLASEESARYALEHMRTTPNFATDYDLHDWIPSQLHDSLLEQGIVVEFGVATARTLNHFARLMPHKTIHGFDSFKGLPEDWTHRMRKGFFARNNIPAVRKNCELWIGWFNDTLPGFVELHKEPIALLHMDCDLYSSAAFVLDALNRQIVPGTVIVFDEYMNYPGWQWDEFRAWQEFCSSNTVEYEYIGRVSRHQKVAVRVLSRDN